LETYWNSFYKDVDKEYFTGNRLIEILELFYWFLNDNIKYCEILYNYFIDIDKHKSQYWLERLNHEKEVLTNG
jgi:hypothetical protein